MIEGIVAVVLVSNTIIVVVALLDFFVISSP